MRVPGLRVRQKTPHPPLRGTFSRGEKGKWPTSQSSRGRPPRRGDVDQVTSTSNTLRGERNPPRSSARAETVVEAVAGPPYRGRLDLLLKISATPAVSCRGMEWPGMIRSLSPTL